MCVCVWVCGCVCGCIWWEHLSSILLAPENLNRPVRTKESETVIKILPTKKSLKWVSFTSAFYQTFKDELVPILLELLPKIEGKEIVPNSFYEAIIILIPKPDKGTTKKKVVQVNIPNEYTCKNPQQNTSKPNSTTH